MHVDDLLVYLVSPACSYANALFQIISLPVSLSWHIWCIYIHSLPIFLLFGNYWYTFRINQQLDGDLDASPFQALAAEQRRQVEELQEVPNAEKGRMTY